MGTKPTRVTQARSIVYPVRWIHDLSTRLFMIFSPSAFFAAWLTLLLDMDQNYNDNNYEKKGIYDVPRWSDS